MDNYSIHITGWRQQLARDYQGIDFENSDRSRITAFQIRCGLRLEVIGILSAFGGLRIRARFCQRRPVKPARNSRASVEGSGTEEMSLAENSAAPEKALRVILEPAAMVSVFPQILWAERFEGIMPFPTASVPAPDMS